MLATMSGLLHNRFHHPAMDQASWPDHGSIVARSADSAPGDDVYYESSFAGKVTDVGKWLTNDSSAMAFSHGLSGVNQGLNYTFSNVIVATFFGLMLATMLYRIFNRGSQHVRHLLTMGSKEVDQRYWMYNHGTWWPRLRKHLIYAPLYGVKHNQARSIRKVDIGTVPGRYHTLLLVLYLLSNTAYTLAIDWRKDNRHSAVAELRGRTGILATLNMIPTFLFAMRNNPLIHIMGVSYDTFNLLHRWCARVVVVESVIHTICWAINCVAVAGFDQIRTSLATSESFRWGMVAACVMLAMFLFATNPLRHKFYEAFLYVHRALAILALAAVYIHLERASLPALEYVWLCIGFWGFEWIMRVSRILWYNYDRRTGWTRVTVEALPSEACRVTFELKRPWTWTPGCHVHAYIPALSYFNSHPFSVAWADRPTARTLASAAERTGSKELLPPPPSSPSDSMVSTLSREKKATSINTVHSTSRPNASVLPRIPVNEFTAVSLVMRARDGMTKHLYQRASLAPNSRLHLRGFLEGPYGGHDALHSYGTVILFAGGVGITHCVGYVRHLVQRYQIGIASTQKVLLVWSVPTTEALEWVRCWMDQIMVMPGRRDILRIQLYVTKPRHRGEVISNTGSVQMFPGRCNPETILEREFEERIGAMAVTVCGPGAFSDCVREAVRKRVDQGGLEFVEEAFTY